MGCGLGEPTYKGTLWSSPAGLSFIKEEGKSPSILLILWPFEENNSLFWGAREETILLEFFLCLFLSLCFLFFSFIFLWLKGKNDGNHSVDRETPEAE